MTEKIKSKAKELGFLDCGFSEAKKLDDEQEVVTKYLQKGYHGQMKFMENHFDKRLNPQLLEPGTKTVISLLYNYYTSQKQLDPNAPIISKYAFGKDYHFVIKDKLTQLLDYIKSIEREIKGRAFVDSAPILERAWARHAGLGWIGKNGLLLNKEFGSFFFIAELIIDIELEYNKEQSQNYCGKCTRCIDACPTKAIIAPGVVNSCKCISYLTIELKDNIPGEFRGKMKNRVFGCDICQDACPFNEKAKEHDELEFKASNELIGLTKIEWYELDEERFSKLFKNSALQRAKYSGLKRNILFMKNSEEFEI